MRLQIMAYHSLSPGLSSYDTPVCEKYWPQETDKSNFHYLPEINNCWPR